MKPFVKWAGGKRQILDRIKDYVDDSFGENGENFKYIEPFLGGGAVFFSLGHKKAVINDLNSDLINAYRVIGSDDYEELIEKLKEHAAAYREDADEHYYDVRAWDREPGWPDNRSAVERAARMIFLNKTCYNGLYRVNSKGQFNTPMGRYRNPTICDEQNIRQIHEYLSKNAEDILIMNGSYQKAIEMAEEGDVIYIDPPYDYDDDDGFTKYQMTGFTFEDFKELKRCCDKAIAKGAIAIISNNATQKVVDLFAEDPHYRISYVSEEFQTLRNINSNGSARRTGREVIVWGMSSNVPFPQANDLEKVVKLVKAGPSILKDRKAAQELIEVGSDRQVIYYLSALKFFEYLTYDNAVTENAKRINHSESAIRKDIFDRLKKRPNFAMAYEFYLEKKELPVDYLKKLISESESSLSEATIARRASTIKTWVKWMSQHQPNNSD